MDNCKKKAIRFLVNLSLKQQKDPRVVKYAASKTKNSGNEFKYFPRKIGGEGGKYAQRLGSMLDELQHEKEANVHSIAVYKDGAIVCETSAPGYDRNVFHLAHSMSKTVTGIAIGLLYDEKRIDLDSLAIDYFPEAVPKDKRAKNITVKHLLTMKSGVLFSELGVVCSDEWIKSFFESELEFSPGERFKYNSMNSYILAAIVTRITGKSLLEYLKEKLFEPLEISNFLWEIGPDGIEKGGFGLYLSCESFLKIGVMLASRGLFNKRRILSKEYTDMMLKPHADASEENIDFDYGLHVWASRDNKEFLLNGMFGQNVWFSRESGFLISMNSGNNELFSASPALKIIRKHLSSISDNEASDRSDAKALKELSKSFFAKRSRVSLLEEKRGISYFLKIKNPRPFDTRWDLVLGEYAFRDNNASLLPLILRTIQNNFNGGIEKVNISRNASSLLLIITEGGTVYKIPVGLYEYTESVLNYNDEFYVIRAGGECTVDEDKNTVYKIDFIFPELPNTRLIKIIQTPEGISLKMSETPNESIAETFFDSLFSDSKTAFALGFIEKKMGDGFFKRKIYEAFNPDLNGIKTDAYGWESVLINDNLALAEERERSSRLVNSLVSKFLNDDTDKRAKSSDGAIKGFFAKALSLLLEKLQPDSNSKADEAQSTIELSDDVVTFLDEQN